MALGVKFHTTNSPLYFCPGMSFNFSEVGAVPMESEVSAWADLTKTNDHEKKANRINIPLKMLICMFFINASNNHRKQR
jgi:hypothetical protein